MYHIMHGSDVLSGKLTSVQSLPVIFPWSREGNFPGIYSNCIIPVWKSKMWLWFCETLSRKKKTQLNRAHLCLVMAHALDSISSSEWTQLSRVYLHLVTLFVSRENAEAFREITRSWLRAFIPVSSLNEFMHRQLPGTAVLLSCFRHSVIFVCQSLESVPFCKGLVRSCKNWIDCVLVTVWLLSQKSGKLVSKSKELRRAHDCLVQRLSPQCLALSNFLQFFA